MREKVLINLATFIAKRPWWTGLILLIITIIMGGMAGRLELTTSFTNLLPKDNPMVDEFNMIIDEYYGSSSMLIVAEGEPEKLEEFASYTDNLEEVFENREQIEISKFYERLPKPSLIAMDEYENDQVYHRNPGIEIKEK